MLPRLDDSIIEEVHRFATVFTSFIHGISPIIGAIALITPHVFLPPFEAFEFAIVICCLSFFILGAAMGKMAEEKVLLNGLRTLIFGIFVMLAVLIFNPGHLI